MDMIVWEHHVFLDSTANCVVFVITHAVICMFKLSPFLLLAPALNDCDYVFCHMQSKTVLE